MRQPPLERTPCPDCGVGIIGKHMKRHTGSATCRRMQKCMSYTKDMFPNARLVGRLRSGWDPAAVSADNATLLRLNHSKVLTNSHIAGQKRKATANPSSRPTRK